MIQNGNPDIKMEFETLITGGCVEAAIDEQIVFSQLDSNIEAVWSLLLASGYLKCEKIIQDTPDDMPIYRLVLTNLEVKKMFEKMIRDWFKKDTSFSYFDAGKKPSDASETEKFYHGFVLGLLVDNAKNYVVKSNRESGYGRYDVVMEPKNKKDPAAIIEFKVYDMEYDKEKDLDDTAANALSQIEEKQYATDLISHGIAEDHIFKYGFAFRLLGLSQDLCY